MNIERKHSSEPWEFYGDRDGFCILNADGQRVHDVQESGCPMDKEDGIRAVACVNACVGMVDPEKEIAELKEFRARYIGDKAEGHAKKLVQELLY